MTIQKGLLLKAGITAVLLSSVPTQILAAPKVARPPAVAVAPPSSREDNSRGSAVFTIHQPIFRWEQEDETSTPEAGESEKIKKTELATTPPLFGLRACWNKWSIYVYPQFAVFISGLPVGISYFATKELEAGLFIGIRQSTEDDKKNLSVEKAKMQILSPFVNYHLDVGDTSICELQYMLTQATNKTTSTTTNERTNVDTVSETAESTLSHILTADFVVPITSQFNYVGGLSYLISTGKTTLPESSKDKSSRKTLTLNLATLRYIF